VSIKNLWKGNRAWLFMGLLFLIILPLSFNSCASEYGKPSTTETPTALISADTLKAWIDAGKVNGTGYDRVVILDVTAQATYDAGHIPGAYYVSTSDTSQSRNEGVAMLSTEVLEGSKMDALVQKYGIDGNTTIVFTGTPSAGPGTGFIARAYFLFRYWGFPKNRLKMLDGGNLGWTAAGYSPTNMTQSLPVPSTFSVRNNLRLRTDLRISLPEMIEYSEGHVPNALAIEGRAAGTTTTGVYSPPAGTDYVVFEGQINGAQVVTFSTLYDAGYKYLPTDQLIAAFTAVGLDSSKSAYVYCRIGVQGAVVFFVLDGILGWPATFYDGSWSQWGQLSGDAANKGQLTANSPWRTDIPSRSSNITYNWIFPRAIEQFTADGSVCSATYNIGGTITNSSGGTTACTNLPDSYDANANRIEEADKAYMNSGSSGGSSGGGGSIPSGC